MNKIGSSVAFTLAFTLAFALAGCGAASVSPAAHSHAHAPAVIDGAQARVVELPTAAGTGEPREVSVLVDEPALKLVSITLRQGTVLGEHHAPIPVTIQALVGAGTVVVGTERLRLDPAHAVVLAAGVAHSVEPDAGTDLILLVHHLGQGEETHR